MKFTINQILKLSFALVLTMVCLVSQASQFTVVIDAGHGGKDVGATDNGVKEKDINLGVATKLAEKIKKQIKGVNVVMTRSTDNYLTLQQRADKANKATGNLFISIHTNSAAESNPQRSKAAGSSTHVLGLSKDKASLAVAQRENSVIKLEKDYKKKYQGFDPESDESYIIFEMVQKKNLSRSIDLAEEIQRQLGSVAGRRDRGVHQNGFWVLWATSMPAVLVELDFICNPNSAKYISSKTGQDKLAQAICNAVKTYYKADKKRSADVGADDSDDDLTADSGTAEYVVIGSDETQEIPDDRKVGAAPENESRHHESATKRRRRSEVSKRKSNSRVFETKEIIVKTEKDLASSQSAPKQVKKAETVTETEPAAQTQKKNSKSRKKASKTNRKGGVIKAKVRTVNGKQVIVSADNDEASSESTKDDSKKNAADKKDKKAKALKEKKQKQAAVLVNAEKANPKPDKEKKADKDGKAKKGGKAATHFQKVEKNVTASADNREAKEEAISDNNAESKKKSSGDKVEKKEKKSKKELIPAGKFSKTGDDAKSADNKAVRTSNTKTPRLNKKK